MAHIVRAGLCWHFLILFFGVVSFAQTQVVTFTGNLDPVETVPVIKMPKLLVGALLLEDIENEELGGPHRFAYSHKVHLIPEYNGKWESLDSNTVVWRQRIQSRGARSLNLGFKDVHIPPGAYIHIVSDSNKRVVGPFDSSFNNPQRELWTPIVIADDVIVEVVVPHESLNSLSFKLVRVSHDYTGFGQSKGLNNDCNIDVACPHSRGWEKQIRSVGAYTIEGDRTCSGVMLNNTENNYRPYFLTAHHCGVNRSNAASMVVYWNYQQSYCRNGVSGEGDGDIGQTTTGSVWRAGRKKTDFTLVELNKRPDPSYKVYWAGWDRRNRAPTSAVAIHHPMVKEKSISFENHQTVISGAFRKRFGKSHIRIVDWDRGTTARGSSGSPLFNESGLVVGQLSGGGARCGNNASDWYGRIFSSWRKGRSRQKSLHHWLDPRRTGLQQIDGLEEVEGSK